MVLMRRFLFSVLGQTSPQPPLVADPWPTVLFYLLSYSILFCVILCYSALFYNITCYCMLSCAIAHYCMCVNFHESLHDIILYHVSLCVIACITHHHAILHDIAWYLLHSTKWSVVSFSCPLIWAFSFVFWTCITCTRVVSGYCKCVHAKNVDFERSSNRPIHIVFGQFGLLLNPPKNYVVHNRMCVLKST